jgi:hypothetical protein
MNKLKIIYTGILFLFVGTKQDAFAICATSAIASNERVNEINLLNIAPNPVLNTAAISFSLAEPGNISIRIYDAFGKLVSVVADKHFNDGQNTLHWNAGNLEAGIYFLQLGCARKLISRKIMVE